MEKIKVLIIDDSALMRQLLTEILSSDPAIDVVGTAADPYVARDKIMKLNPDVLTLDVEMPRMDGLTFLEKLMTSRPMPVVMVSPLTERGCETTYRAPEIGAFDFVTKPKLDVANSMLELSDELTRKVRGAASARVRLRPVSTQSQTPITKAPLASDALITSTHKVLAIGTSTGFAEMAQQAASAVKLSQCRVQSREGMNKVLDAARKTLDEVDTIAREARMAGLSGQIEAARAGQQGIAFSVMANETKSLALHAATTSDMLKKMLNELAVLHEQLVDALQSSESTSECLSREISRAVMGLQFQDRVNQQIQHITETLDAIYDRAVPITEQVPPRKVAARLEDWREWMQSRSTMESERAVAGSCAGTTALLGDEFGSVE